MPSKQLSIFFLLCCCFRYNSRIRKQQSAVLQQELAVPLPPMVSTEPLPPARNLLDQPLFVPGADHQYCLPPDTSGQASQFQRRRRQTSTTASQLIPAAVTYAGASADLRAGVSPQPDTELSVPSLEVPVIGGFTDPDTDLSVETVDVDPAVPKTTAWRRKRNAAMGITGTYKKRKEHYSCKKCGQPSTVATGHSQYKGYKFCPNEGQTKEEWLAAVKFQILVKQVSNFG